MSTCIIMSGVAGSGKSTWVKAWVAEHSECSVYTISLDDLRSKLFGKYSNLTHQQENEMWRQVIVEAIEASWSYDYLIIDSTALKNKRRMWYYNHLRHFWGQFELVIIDKPLEVCLTQNRKRERQVPNRVIEEMYNYQEQPNEEVIKAFDKIYTYK